MARNQTGLRGLPQAQLVIEPLELCKREVSVALPKFYIVIQKAKVAINETGAVAAAATGVGFRKMKARSCEDPEFTNKASFHLHNSPQKVSYATLHGPVQ